MTTTRSAAAEPAPSEPLTAPPFAVISGAQVQHALQGREKQIVELVEATYRLHSSGDSVNPPSYFLRFPDRGQLVGVQGMVIQDVTVEVDPGR